MYPDATYQTPRSPRKKFLIVFGALLLLAILLVAVLKTGRKSGGPTASPNGSLITYSLGANAYIKLPSDFVATPPDKYNPRIVGNFKPESGTADTNSPESVSIAKYGDRLDTIDIDTLQDTLTNNAYGPIPGITSEKIQRTNDDGNGKDVLKITSNDDKTKLIISRYYYLYDKDIWLVTIAYNKDSFLDRSQSDIMNSFVAGDLL